MSSLMHALGLTRINRQEGKQLFSLVTDYRYNFLSAGTPTVRQNYPID